MFWSSIEKPKPCVAAHSDTGPAASCDGRSSLCKSGLASFAKAFLMRSNIGCIIGSNPRNGSTMIDVYTWPTPNGHKVHIMLEECALPYKVHAVNIGAGDQFQPDFLA